MNCHKIKIKALERVNNNCLGISQYFCKQEVGKHIILREISSWLEQVLDEGFSAL